MTRTPVLLALLVVAGAAWGASQPLTKTAVSEGYRHFGLLFWQLTLGAAFLGAVMAATRRRLPLAPRYLGFYALIALIGTIVPGIVYYNTARHLPAGILSILLSSIPMLSFPLALAMGNDHFRWRRVIGLWLGFAGVLMLALPDATLPDPAQSVWIPIALLSSACYAIEGNIVARWGTMGLGSVQVLTGASLVGALLTLPMALASGQFIDPRGPWGAPDYALIASSVLHVLAYTMYVWLVGVAGSVFAVQVSYLVTLFGLVWSMIFLNEAYAGPVWLSLLLMLAGLFFVQPRPRAALVSAAPLGQNSP
ncbi:DMT family transporter [Mesobacterium sp. TK19101]|uniref:DMT family transporter n=1 Tax=Mesobacterium hydrothermale TaxID=3111907 RepID=A0ABU6HJ93_9RHOB|nr:DMT family transporter [Mesobacterium sp. TK19101]MEC3862532.1 DMT family transporter [Mesobacterium sp. TK19101]